MDILEHCGRRRSGQSCRYEDCQEPNRQNESECKIVKILLSRDCDEPNAGSPQEPREILPNFSSETPCLELFFAKREQALPGATLTLCNNMDGTQILCALQHLDAHPWFASSVLEHGMGFQNVKATKKYADTSYFAAEGFAIAWTFVPEKAWTRVLLIRNDAEIFREFQDLLLAASKQMTTPLLPLLAAVLTVINRTNQEWTVAEQCRSITAVDRDFIWNSVRDRGPSAQHVVLTDFTCYIAITHARCLKSLNALEYCGRALDDAMKRHHEAIPFDFPKHLREDFESATGDILDCFTVLRSRIVALKLEIDICRSRSEAQRSFLYALLTHEDSVTNLKAANAAADVALAMKKDSSAMKTVAVMTMAFLPGTFLAALFAVPSLEWKHRTTVHMDGFSLYWAVAIPATLLVFAAWGIITGRETILAFFRPRRDGEGESEQASTCGDGDEDEDGRGAEQDKGSSVAGRHGNTDAANVV